MQTVTYLLFAILLTSVAFTAMLYRWMGRRSDPQAGHGAGNANIDRSHTSRGLM
jgi:hypothetical protein